MFHYETEIKERKVTTILPDQSLSGKICGNFFHLKKPLSKSFEPNNLLFAF